MVISDNGASAEGGPTGTTNEAQFFNNAQEPFEDSLAAIDEIGGPQALQPLSVGLDVGGQHAVSPLEARDLPRRRLRPVHRALAGAASSAKGEVREQYAHIIDMVPTVLDVLGIEPPATDPRRDAVAAARGQLRRTPSTTRQRPADAPHPVLRDARPPRDLPRRLAGGVPVAGPVVHRGRQGVRRADLRRDAHRARRAAAGSSTTWPRTSPRTTTWPPRTATS